MGSRCPNWALPAYLLLLLLVPLARRYVRDGRLTLGALEDALAFGVPPVVLALVAFYALATYRRNEVWKTPVSLWSDTVAKSPRLARGRCN